MPFEIKVELDSGLAIAICWGTLSIKDAKAGAEALWSHPDWKGEAAVWDFRSARFDVSTSQVREVAQFVLAHQPERPPARMAYVTGQDADFGMARMFEVFRESPHTQIRVFRDLEEALDWARGTGPKR